MQADPDLDAIIPAGGGGEPLQGAISAIEKAGKTGEIAVVSTDFLPDLGERLANGSMAGESGGHYCDPLFAFLLTYNAIKGNESYLKPAGEFGKNLLFPYLYVASPDDYANYDKYFVQDTPYTDEELTAMGGMDYADLEAACSALSIEDVMARHGAGAAETEAE
jgi:ribose transport system substrate-binding protein